VCPYSPYKTSPWPSPYEVSRILNDAYESCARPDERAELLAVKNGLREWQLKDIFAQGQVNRHNWSKERRGSDHSAYLLMVLEYLRRSTVLVLMDSEENISPGGTGVVGTLPGVHAEADFTFRLRLKIGDKLITYTIPPEMTTQIQGLVFDPAGFAYIPVHNWKWDYPKGKGAPREGVIMLEETAV
jgi:hypothetical protein